MGINAIEVDSSAPDSTPSPTYVDQNITLYSIPIHPESSGNQLKRKRKLSPLLSSKKPLLSDPGTSDASSIEPSIPISLLERMRLPGFSPTSLRDEDAQEWRKVTIDHMFPWKAPPPLPPKIRKQKKGKGNVEAEIEPPPPPPPPAPYLSRKGPQSFNPSGCDKQLPTFIHTKDGEPIPPSLKPTLAYVLVGPKIRGKFDNAKATNLGLTGRLRGEVAGGHTVTFTVSDGKGGQVERTVKPEDCVGPSESPGVSTRNLLIPKLL